MKKSDPVALGRSALAAAAAKAEAAGKCESADAGAAAARAEALEARHAVGVDVVEPTKCDGVGFLHIFRRNSREKTLLSLDAGWYARRFGGRVVQEASGAFSPRLCTAT